KEDPIKHAPGWRGENASDSEASVKADRENHPANVEDLQKQSVEHLKSDSDHAIHGLKEKVEKAQHIVEENVSQVEENTKEFAEKAKKEFGKSGENIVDGVKSGTDKATEFVKESFESVKKAFCTMATTKSTNHESGIEELRENLAELTLKLRNTQDLMDAEGDLEASQAGPSAALSNLSERELELENTKTALANSERVSLYLVKSSIQLVPTLLCG
ncbi:hypothetical protein BGZ46_005296, partial [Entomortierella lignicola]